MTRFARSWTLVAAFARRDRWLLLGWISGGWLLYWSQAVSVEELYATAAELDKAAASMGANPALIALAGPARALDTVGGQVAWQASAFGAITAGLMSMFLVGRHTRAEEESGRDELVRAAAVGPFATLAATVVVATSANVVLGAVVAVSLAVYGLPVAGSVALGLALTSTGLVFMAFALVAAQLTAGTRAMYGWTGAFIGVAFVLRAVGDVGGGALSWLSPIGWGQYVRPYADEQWWPLGLSVLATAALALVARALFDRRDFGAGLWRARPGPPTGTIGSFRLAWRLQRGALFGWCAGMFLVGLAYGSVGDSAADVIGDSEFAKEVFGAGSDSVVDGFYATAVSLLALMAAGFAISSALRPQREEDDGRVELILSTGLSRLRWALGHAAVTAGGAVLVVLVGGLGLGLSYGLVVGDPAQLGRMTWSALSYVPAVLVLSGFVRVQWGAIARASTAGWMVLAGCVAIMLFAKSLRLPAWLVAVSPFSHVPLVPVEDPAAVPLLVLATIAAALTVAGHAAFRQRDIR